MFIRIGHTVKITKGPDKDAIGKIIEVDDDIIYVEKSEGNFMEMYNNHNIFGFYSTDIKIVKPHLKPKDVVKVVRGENEEGPAELIDKQGTVKSFKDGIATVVIEGTPHEIKAESLFLVLGKEKTLNSGTFNVKIDDIVYIKRGKSTRMCRVVDKSGVSYEVQSMDGDHYEVKRSQIFKKISLSDMMKHVVKENTKQIDSAKAQQIYKSLKALRMIDTEDDGNYRDYKQMLQAKLKQQLTVREGPIKFELRGTVYEIDKQTLKNPTYLKQSYWEFLRRRERARGAKHVSSKSMFGVSYKKQGSVYTEAGLFSRVNKKLKSTDLIYNPKSPFTKSKYVGIEIEMFSNLDRDSLNAKLTEAGLGRNISLCNDNSIKDTGNKYPIEVRILSTEKNLPNVMERTLKVLADAGAEVNKTCGLHVHLDMRNRNVKKAYRNLVGAQDMLFKAVAADRATNRYCKPVVHKDFDRAIRVARHYDAISAEAYRKHKSLEIRMHEGTLDKEKILNWVNILVSIVENKSVTSHYLPDKFVAQLSKASQEDKDYFKQRLAA